MGEDLLRRMHFSEEKINIMIALGADVSRTSQFEGMYGAHN